MTPDDLQRDLDSLWQRVTGGGPPEAGLPAAPSFSAVDDPSFAREASLDLIHLLKKRHRAELGRLEQLVLLKERSIKELSERLSAADAQISLLQRKSLSDEDRIYKEVFNVSIDLENAHKAAQAAQARFNEEEKILRSVAEETRRQLAAETARWRELEGQWNEREQQYLLDIKELQALLHKAQDDAGKESSAARKSMGDLKEAKTAIEKTLAELLQERQERARADSERDRALARVKEVEEHMRDLQNLWEAERKQWAELWDRERSTWEAQRQEFAAWEGKVRQERQQWHADLSQIEERQTRYASQLTDLLRRSTDAGEKVAALLRRAAASPHEALRLAVFSMPALFNRRAAAVLLAAALASAYPVWRMFHRMELEPLANLALPVADPSSMASDGAKLYVGAWSGDILSLDPDSPSTILSQAKISVKDPYHPASMALWGETLYTLDAAQGRILKHDARAPGTILAQWPTPGPAPVALAYDGQNLWSYDAVSRVLYRYLGEGGAQTEAYTFDADIVPSALAFDGGRLWAYDSKGKRLLMFSARGHLFKLWASRPFESLGALGVVSRSTGKGSRRELWGLTVPSSGASAPSLKKYRIR